MMANAPTFTVGKRTGIPRGEYAAAVIAEHASRATELGAALAAWVADPAAFSSGLARAFQELADPEYRDGQAFVDTARVTRKLGDSVSANVPAEAKPAAAMRATRIERTNPPK